MISPSHLYSTLYIYILKIVFLCMNLIEYRIQVIGFSLNHLFELFVWAGRFYIGTQICPSSREDYNQAGWQSCREEGKRTWAKAWTECYPGQPRSRWSAFRSCRRETPSAKASLSLPPEVILMSIGLGLSRGRSSKFRMSQGLSIGLKCRFPLI